MAWTCYELNVSYMAENQAEGADAAVEFLQSHEDVWKNWVGADMRIKIKNAL